ncbi:urea ABC transporter substrate-binding protein [Lichenibacterium dinghuense]|uniref:urea ABC transporter substrate-binding protein n=1 Tax=Lichenibacterium dinghuense TaxID=2895977 RepID=UPI001F01AAD8|nr:urea ABC transporter substrate-binding protein [Lichenibacterium sp. 6Y81]
MDRFAMNRRQALLGASALAATATLGARQAFAADETVKVGILHSLSGTMAISETTLKDVMLMLIDAQNKKGGVLGRKLEAVVVDPASNWPLFAEKARGLISQDKVAACFGCWTSVSRKSVLPVFKELDNLLFYPVQYEGEESERNVIYTGAAPNQQAIPAVDYLMSPDGGSVKRWVLAGTDYVYPRTTNKILEAYLKLKGVADSDIMINYTPFGQSDWQTIVSDIKKFGSAGKKTAVVSTINGDANVPFYKELANQGIKATDIPVVAFSVGEEELAGMDTKNLVGHLAAWNYFESIDTPANKAFIDQWHGFTKNPKRTTNDPMEAHYIGFNAWVKAVEKAQSFKADDVIDHIIGVTVPNLTGGYATVMENHHVTKPVYIGEIQADGQINVVWQTPGTIVADAWSPYLPGSKDLIADWRPPMNCGNYNVKTGKCGGAG